MLRGMATSIFYADDLEAAKDWYAEFFGIEPYYHVPGGYYEFRIGDYQHEFGLVNRAYAPAGARNAPGGAIVHWHVDDLRATVDRLLELGATTYDRSPRAATRASSPPRWSTPSATSWD